MTTDEPYLLHELVPGLYRNRAGGELHVTTRAINPGTFYTLDVDIWYADGDNRPFATPTYLVTVSSMNAAGYQLVEADIS